MPTDILRPFGLIHLIPIFLTIHLVVSIPLRAKRLTSNQWFLESFSALVALRRAVEAVEGRDDCWQDANQILCLCASVIATCVVPPNAGRQARPKPGAERTLWGVAWTPWLGL